MVSFFEPKCFELTTRPASQDGPLCSLSLSRSEWPLVLVMLHRSISTENSEETVPVSTPSYYVLRLLPQRAVTPVLVIPSGPLPSRTPSGTRHSSPANWRFLVRPIHTLLSFSSRWRILLPVRFQVQSLPKTFCAGCVP